ncbi:DNA-processing protein DprA [Frankia sp. B2]|uniref:DNA-processing protein DprA n=1 Tax=Frankia sp. B2 TaxID=2541730 RepID=UPI00141AD769|nr:DNA-processing protein DprA [Frankia sp. B2]
MTDHEERLARIGLACAASLRPLPIPADGETSPVRLWERIGASQPTVDPARVLADAERAGWRILVPGDAEWPPVPPGTADIGEAPWALWVRGEGDLGAATRRSVAVIGARASTGYGEQVAALLAGDLANREWTVVTSCALGCDSHAYTAAARGTTAPIAVYAAQPDLERFRRHRPEPRLLLSDAPPDTPAGRHRYLTSRTSCATCPPESSSPKPPSIASPSRPPTTRGAEAASSWPSPGRSPARRAPPPTI